MDPKDQSSETHYVHQRPGLAVLAHSHRLDHMLSGLAVHDATVTVNEAR